MKYWDLSPRIDAELKVWPGDTLTGRATVRSLEPGEGEGLVGLDVVATNQKGEAVVAGEATAALPRRG